MLLKRNKKQKIVLAAIAQFAKHGFEKASIDAIALKAKVAKGTVFYHFKSKQDLFEAIVEEGQRRFEEKIKNNIQDLPTNFQKIETIIEIEINFIQKYHDLFSVYINDTLKKVESFKIIEDVLKAGIKKGEFRSDLDVPTVTIALFWLTAMTCLHSKKIDPVQLKKLVLNGIVK